MTDERLAAIQQFIKQKGDEIQQRLPSLPGHPTRQAQAHLYKEIKLRFGVPVKQIPDDRFEDVMRLLSICVENAEDPHVGRHLTWVEPITQQCPGSLEDFL